MLPAAGDSGKKKKGSSYHDLYSNAAHQSSQQKEAPTHSSSTQALPLPPVLQKKNSTPHLTAGSAVVSRSQTFNPQLNSSIANKQLVMSQGQHLAFQTAAMRPHEKDRLIEELSSTLKHKIGELMKEQDATKKLRLKLQEYQHTVESSAKDYE